MFFGRILSLIFGNENDRAIKRYREKVKKINNLEEEFSSLSDDELRQKTIAFKERIRLSRDDKKDEEGILLAEKRILDEILPEAFAVVREASKRVLGMRHFDVQLIGGMALHDGNIAEMSTGEGKTLVATLPAYLNALSGRGVHIITVNDYLVKRDSEWMGKLYSFLGLSVGCVIGDTEQENRNKEYAKDITYVSNTEIGFDYLRDNMKATLSDTCIVNRGFNYAIIDEVDSILIDESRTPLIISGPTEQNTKLYNIIDDIVKQLKPDDYEIDEKRKNVQLSDKGNENVENLLKKVGLLQQNDTLYGTENSFALLNFIIQSLRANTMFHNGVDYIVKNGEVVIIDEFTGRIMDGRRYSDGLHQALEAKEGVKIEPENQTLASITYQNFFRMYRKLSGMTGTAKTEASEFYDIYKLPIITIPTNKPIARKELDDMVFKNEDDKFEAIVKTVKEAHEKGQPVLIGTISIEKSERLSKLLTKEGLKHNLLNAKYHEKEAEIIAEAGRFGAITIATNMAGRGTDIMLGGNVQKEIDRAIEEEKKKFDNGNDNNKNDNEFNNTLKSIQSIVGEKRNTNVESSINVVKSQHFDAVKIAEEIKEKHKAEYQKVVDAGGLFVIGSERHENRRIDNQLKGRSGRQGDPGKTQFFLSLKDDLLRIFGGDKIDAILSKIGFKDKEPLNHPMLNGVINRSQKKIETYHYEVRKNLLKYDDIINEQRKVIYEQRMSFVKSTNINGILKQMISDVNEDILNNATENEKVNDKLAKELMQQVYGFAKSNINISNFNLGNLNRFCNMIYANLYTDVDLFALCEIQRRVMLQTLDECWREHLYYLDHIREGIHLRAYAQKDPFNEYKFECYSLMQKTMNKFIKLVVGRSFNMQINVKNNDITANFV